MIVPGSCTTTSSPSLMLYGGVGDGDADPVIAGVGSAVATGVEAGLVDGAGVFDVGTADSIA